MEDFKKLPKMQHFKEGGGVKNAYCGGGKAYKKGGEVHDKADEKEDKKLIKKAFGMHDKQSHEGEKTDLSKLKKGGRAKKDCGTVRKYKAGGIIGMKKTAEDKKEIANIKKMETGGMTGAISDAAKRLKDNVMGTEAQNAAATKNLDKVAKQNTAAGAIERGVRSMTGEGAVSDAERSALSNPKKKGGKC